VLEILEAILVIAGTIVVSAGLASVLVYIIGKIFG